MSELTPEIAPEIVSACNENSAEVAGALERGIDAAVSVTVDEVAAADPSNWPSGFDGPGLIALLQFGEKAIAAVLPQTAGLTPDWARDPDVTGEGKLNTLAQELSMLVVPESLFADKFAAAWVDNIAEAIGKAELGDGAQLVPLTAKVAAGEAEAQISLLWPFNATDNLLPAPKTPSEPGKDAESGTPPPTARRAAIVEELPSYARHLLKIEVPVTVTMVAKKLAVQDVIELGQGAMITFEKSCDSPLELSVGDQTIALGSAVKIGENFGLEITEMTMPREHFWPAKRA